MTSVYDMHPRMVECMSRQKLFPSYLICGTSILFWFAYACWTIWRIVASSAKIIRVTGDNKKQRRHINQCPKIHFGWELNAKWSNVKLDQGYIYAIIQFKSTVTFSTLPLCTWHCWHIYNVCCLSEDSLVTRVLRKSLYYFFFQTFFMKKACLNKKKMIKDINGKF